MFLHLCDPLAVSIWFFLLYLVVVLSRLSDHCCLHLLSLYAFFCMWLLPFCVVCL